MSATAATGCLLLTLILITIGYYFVQVPQPVAASVNPLTTTAKVYTLQPDNTALSQLRAQARITQMQARGRQVILDAKIKAAKEARAAAARKAATVLTYSSSAMKPVGYTEPDNVPGIPAGSYMACVAWRESSDIPTWPTGLFGFLQSTWSWAAGVPGFPGAGYGDAGAAPVPVQIQAFIWEYNRYGHSAWPDGC